MKAGLRRAIALSLGLCALTIPASAASTFSDVPSSYWGYSYITEAASKGLVSGIGNGKYGPEDTLSNAQFVTMVCNMFYSDLVKAQGTSADWWRPYMNVAQATGLLSGTTAGNQYAASGAFTAANANSQISRYDMAQIMYNVGIAQKWDLPDSWAILLNLAVIQDSDSIPTNYQMAVGVCYAKGFLSGDENGNFNGASTTTRAQAAVVLCSLNKAKTQVTAPTYTNSNRLANGLVATEENVANLIDDVWASYPDYDQWNVNTTYTSQRLGVGTGSKGFAYMISDKIFGGMPANQIDDPADLRLGDVISFNSGSQYGVVCEADENTFSYVTCDSSGFIDWSNDMYRDDLDRYDTVYTRYLNMPEPDDVLSNGKEATKANVEDILDDLQDDNDYENGATWRVDKDYESDVLGEAVGDRALAYRISDEIFGDLDYENVDDVDDLRIGDVIYDRYNNGLYGVVVSINWSTDVCTYVSVDDDEDIYWHFTCDLNDITTIYTRYPEDAEYDDDRDDTLANGESITPAHVDSLLNDVLGKSYGNYYDDGWWDMGYRYNSDSFSRANGSEGFAYFISDKVFDDLKVYDLDDPEELRVGDIVEVRSDYGIVTETWNDSFEYVTVDEDGYTEYSEIDYDSSRIGDMYTRYPD